MLMADGTDKAFTLLRNTGKLISSDRTIHTPAENPYLRHINFVAQSSS